VEGDPDAAGARTHGERDVDEIAPEIAAQAEDVERLWEAYEAYAPALRRYATARLRDHAAADDIVQETFLRLALEPRLRSYPAQPRAWLYRVALNLIISGARRSATARRRAAEDGSDDEIFESPESQFLTSERRHDLGMAMDAAGPAGRAGLILAAQGFSGREIAEALGRSEGATRTLLCRARREVRRELSLLETASLAG
jgi:RNA polymerase sigma-70 factor (ECF subfamily)